MKIEVLGPGCANCRTLEENVREAVRELGLDAEVEKVTELGRIMARGVMSSPAIVVNDRVVSSGRVLSVDEIKELLVP